MYRSFLLSVVILTLVTSITQASPWVARHGLSSADYQAEYDKWTGQGYRLEHVSGYGVGDRVFYAAIWEKKPGPEYVARHGLTGAQYQAEFNHWTGHGYRLALLDGYGVGNQALYAAIWEKISGPPQVVRHGITIIEYEAELRRLARLGYRIQRVSGYGVGEKVFYAAIWEQKTVPYRMASLGLTSAQYQAEIKDMPIMGFHLALVDGYGVGDRALYAAVWESPKSGPPWVARHGLTGAEYQAEFNRLVGQGYRLRLIEGYGLGNQAYYAAIWELESGQAFVARHGMTGTK